MRTIKELLQLMLDNKQMFYDGLCSWKNELHFRGLITSEELSLLYKYIANNKPFTLHRMFSSGSYYWKMKNIKPRIKWLKYHISIN